METELEKNKILPEIWWMKCHDQGRENGEIRGKDREKGEEERGRTREKEAPTPLPPGVS